MTDHYYLSREVPVVTKPDAPRKCACRMRGDAGFNGFACGLYVTVFSNGGQILCACPCHRSAK